MKKEKDILIRVTEDLKESLKKKAERMGLSLSSFIRIILIKEIENG